LRSIKKLFVRQNSAITGAAFLMATSAIGPGFLTQTAVFTADMLASFGFVILVSLLIDIGTQVNIWSIIAVSRKHAQDLANFVFPGVGVALAGLVSFGGLIFNIGNIAGCGLGLNALAGIPIHIGSIISCVIALGLFWFRDAGKLLDHFARLLGLIMIGLTLYIAFSSDPPIQQALFRTIWPEEVDALKIVTLVGGTVGGYITFAGAHRLLDAGISGKESLKAVKKSAVTGILITTLMRYILFLAALGVVWSGVQLDAVNPPGSVFKHAAGNTGYRFFGLVMWCAAITSVVGASFTSVSFIKTLSAVIFKNERWIITIFIILSTIIFLLLGNPVLLLIAAGALNGLILPVALAVILIASRKSGILEGYRHPVWMQIAGWLVVIVMGWMGSIMIVEGWKRLF
jgi:Mn2+/Fe2+ NRAMP family transporter